MATIKNIARSRSIPNINTLFSDPINPNSTISISSLNNFQANDFLSKSSAPSHRISAMDLTWNGELSLANYFQKGILVVIGYIFVHVKFGTNNILVCSIVFC